MGLQAGSSGVCGFWNISYRCLCESSPSLHNIPCLRGPLPLEGGAASCRTGRAAFDLPLIFNPVLRSLCIKQILRRELWWVSRAVAFPSPKREQHIIGRSEAGRQGCSVLCRVTCYCWIPTLLLHYEVAISPCRQAINNTIFSFSKKSDLVVQKSAVSWFFEKTYSHIRLFYHYVLLWWSLATIKAVVRDWLALVKATCPDSQDNKL